MIERSYYFGCVGTSGHFLWRPPGLPFYVQHERPTIPWEDHGLDAKLAPGYIGPYQSGPQNEGEALLHHREGWTAVAFWDRSVDGRQGANSVFLVRGTHSFEEACRIAREDFPGIWERFKFEVKLKA